MSSMHLRPSSQDAAENRFIMSMSILFVVASFYVTYYILFFCTVGVDMTKDIGVEYRGKDGSANMRVIDRNQNYNQCIQEFIDSITYEIKPVKRLRNGDGLTITARYDEALASHYHVNPTQTVHRVKVKDLLERFADISRTPASFLSTPDDRTRNYLNKNMEQILNENFTSFFTCSQPELVNQKQMYRVFLDGKRSSAGDKIIDIYAIATEGEASASSKKEILEMKKDAIYYMIIYNEINTSLHILDENVYGEKLIISESDDLTGETQFISFMKSRYKSAYEIQIMKSKANSQHTRYGSHKEVWLFKHTQRKAVYTIRQPFIVQKAGLSQ